MNRLNRSFVAVQFDLVNHAKRFRPQQEQAREKILQYILKREADGNAADTENLDKIARLKRGSDDGELPPKTPNRIMAAPVGRTPHPDSGDATASHAE